MKNWKHYRIIYFMLILVLLFIFIACEKNNDPVLCNCEIKEHLGINETCCGGDDCNCSEQITILTGTEINIRKQAGISIEQMNLFVYFITDYFNNKLGINDKNKIKLSITEINIVSGNEANKIGTIWHIGINANKDSCDDSLFFEWN